jgi:hypothetical protein
MFKKLLFAFLLGLVVCATALAQEVEVDKYNISARIDLAASALDVRAKLDLTNLGQSPKSKIYLRLAKVAKVGSATAGGAPAQIDVTEDHRAQALNQLIVTPQSPIPPGGHATVELNYRIEAPETTPLYSIYPGEVLLTPESIWFPAPSTHFSLYGPTMAPYSLTVSTPEGSGDFRAASGGTLTSGSGSHTFTFEQKLNSLPLIVAGLYDPPMASEHGGVKIEIYLQPGLVSGAGGQDHGVSGGSGDGSSSANSATPVRSAQDGGTQAARIMNEAGRIVDFFARTLGPPPAGSTFSVISSVHAGNITVPGALVLNEEVFRQDVLGATTVESLADAISRMWIDGRVRIRGQEGRSAQADRPSQKGFSPALLRDSLPRFLAALYFEDRFGKEAAGEVFARMRAVYAPVAQSRRDSELAVQTLILSTYSAAVFAKGPLVCRLMSTAVGRDKFLGALRQMLDATQSKVVTIETLRAALGKTPVADKIFQDWVFSIIEPDIIIGIPQPTDKPDVQTVNLRNLGTGDVPVQVLAVTASGKQLTAAALVPSGDLASVNIPTSEKIVSVEADPDKYIIQSNYDNDSKPVRLSPQTLLNDGIVAFNKGEHAQAEAKFREGLKSSPHDSLLHAWLARSLAAQNKNDEAEAEANAAIRIEPPLTTALSWAHITLGQVALARNQPAEAVRNLRRAKVEATEAPAQFAVRELLIKAERSGGKSPSVDEPVRTFVTQFDGMIKQPSSDKLYTLAIKNNLKKFVQGLTVAPPTAWTTEVLSVDKVDANRIAVDVGLTVKASGRDQTGTAVFILYREGGTWMLENVESFNVK